jgi:Electron transfer flavoprotein, alpha subunit
MSGIIVFSSKIKYINDALPLAYLLKEKEEIIGVSCYEKNLEEIANNGFDVFYYSETEILNDQWYEILINIANEIKPKYLIAPSSKDNIEILARIASKLGYPMVTDVSNLEKTNDTLIFHKPVLGGRATAIFKIQKDINLAITVPLRKFKYEAISTKAKILKIEKIPVSQFQIIGKEEKKKSAVKIEEADIVIGVGRGFKAKEDLKLAFDLAEVLNAQVGCSRPIAADYKWLPDDVWIGISNKSIRPKLYIAVGISGAPQHVSSVTDSKVIVAINNDKNAPIFKYADYCIVADLYQFLPILTEKLRKFKKS